MIDLHFHSSISDGALSPQDVAQQLIRSGVKVCALTDHDTVDGLRDFHDALRGSGIRMIPGVELTALYREHEIHLLGYDFDTKTMGSLMSQRKQLVASQRPREFEWTCASFRKAGFLVSNNLQPDSKLPIGYIVARDVYRNPGNQRKLKGRNNEMITPEEFFSRYQAPGKPCYVQRSGVSYDWVFENIRPVVDDLLIAHPRVLVSFSSLKLGPHDLQYLTKNGCTGIELYHALTPENEIREIKKIVDAGNLSYSGGSDNHGRPDDIPHGQYGEGRVIPNFQLNTVEHE